MHLKKIKQSPKSIIILVIVGIVVAALCYFLYFSPYPQLKALKQQKYSQTFYDRNGNLLQVTTLEDGLRREFTPIKKIPKNVKRTFIKAEDKRFYFHNGVDLISLFAAFTQNTSSGRTVRGASTIPMQLAKIIDKTDQQNSSQPVTESQRYQKKLTDIFNALRIDARLTKSQILELYLNSVPFGSNTEGVTSAARSFFGLELNQLSPEQIKCLSVIPRRPTLYNPVINPEECAKRAGVDLSVAQSARLYEYPFLTPHYVDYLKTITTETEVNTTIDLGIQQKGEKFLRTAMEQAADSRIANGAVLLLDNSTGNVLCWIGNNNWFDEEHHGQLDGVLINNQPGSSMKPFLYALALDTKDENNLPLYYPSLPLADVPKEFGNQTLYIPANFNNRFNGPVRFRISLASSLNIPAVSLLDQLGVDNYLSKLYELGFDSLKNGGKEADLGLALGAGEVSLKELVTAFSVFTRDGIDFKGNQIYSKDTARLICSILSDKNARALGFGYTQTFQTDYPSIFKTGTANQYQNIVALGSTKKYTVGVWMGNFEGQTVVGKTGSSLPAYVAKQLLDLLEKNQSYDEMKFAEPEHWHKQKLCSLSGMKAGPYCNATCFDYIFDDSEPEECTWHQLKNNEIETIYPPEYQHWILQNKISANLDYNASPLTITTPNDQALFYFSDQNSTHQDLNVEVIGGSSDTLLVEYDEKFYASIPRPFVFSLPVERGQHSFTVSCGEEELTQFFDVK